MLNKIYEETNLSDIDSLIKFFAHCLKEVVLSIIYLVQKLRRFSLYLK